MSNFDLVLRNASIVDGTGAPAFAGDVGIRGDRIAAVGRIETRGARELDARGLDARARLHRHPHPLRPADLLGPARHALARARRDHGGDGQLLALAGAGAAPAARRSSSRCSRASRTSRRRPSTRACRSRWESFGDYLAHIRKGLGLNVGALVGHSALRFYVMGAASQERAATDAEIAEMCRLLEEAMAAGAIGLSISYVDIDENMVPVPSRWADEREKLALCQAMAKSGRGVLQTVPYFIDLEQQLENIKELGRLSRGSGVLCSLAPIVSSPVNADAWKRSLAALEAERELGGRVYAQSMPRTFDLNMRLSETSFLLYGLPTWNRFMSLPLAERIAAFGDPANRKTLVEEGMRIAPLLMASSIGEVFSAENQPLARPLAAADRGRARQEPARRHARRGAGRRPADRVLHPRRDPRRRRVRRRRSSRTRSCTSARRTPARTSRSSAARATPAT